MLGPLEVVVDDHPIGVGGPRERTLLLRLLVEPNRVVPADRLIEDLWGEEPPERALAGLRVGMSKLRKALGDKERIVTTAPGYRLNLQRRDCDALRFEEMVGRARQQRRARRLSEAERILRAALGLWRGPALAEVRDLPWASTEVVRLDELRCAALEERLDADLALGRHAELVGELEALVATYPFRERFWAARILALYRAGRQAEALRAYQQLRRQLAEELGIDPSPELRGLEAAVLAQDPALSWRPEEGEEPRTSMPAPTGTAEAGSPLGLPARLAALTSESLFRFAGRAEELEQLAAALKRAATDGRLEVVLLGGEPGIGKTAVAARAALVAHRQGVSLLYGGCEEGLAVPYQPWIRALSSLVSHAGTELLEAHVEVHGSVLARLVPALARRLRDVPALAVTDPETERFLLFEAVVGLLAGASAEVPLLMLLDDLQWADATSLQMLHHLVLSSVPLRLLVVGTYRDTDLSRTNPLAALLADLRREHNVARLHLDGLRDVELIQLLESAAGQDLSDRGVALAHALQRETGGNPFFAVEMLRHLAETGAIVLDDDGRYRVPDDVGQLGLPGSVREVVGSRVARLGSEAGRILSVAAVIGEDFELDVLAQVADADEDHVLDVLDSAAAATIVTEAEGLPLRYRFAHALIRHTLYQDMSAARRQRAHRRVAQTLEELGGADGGRVAELAHHWLAATRPTDLDKAFHYARRAAEGALGALAPLDAVGWYEQALDLLGQHAELNQRERAALLVGLGEAQCQAGQPGYRETLLEAAAEAQRVSDTEQLVAAALANTRGYSSFVAVDAERLAVLQAALAAVGGGDSESRARLLAVMAGQVDPLDWRQRRALASEAIAVARRLDDDRAMLAVLTATYGSRAQPESIGERLTDTEREVVLADGLGDPVARCLARYNRLHACLESGDIVEVDARLDEMRAIVEQTGLPYLQQLVLLSRYWRLLLDGRTAEAEAASTQVLEIGTRIGQAEALSMYGAQLFRIRHEQGRLSEIVDLVAHAAADNPTLPSLRAALIEVYCELGRRDEARALFAHDVASDFSDFPLDIVWLTSMVRCADSAAELGDRDAAEVLYQRLAPFADMVAGNPATVAGSVARPLGRLATLLGQCDAAEAHLRDALAVHERLRAPYWIARTQLDWADLLLVRDEPGDRQAARELVRASRQIAEAHDYAGLRARADGLAEPRERR